MLQDKYSDCSREEDRLVSLPYLGRSAAKTLSMGNVCRDACSEEAAGPWVPSEALNADEEKGIDRQHDSKEELTTRCVVRS